MKIVFDESLYTGNELIDGEHKELISRVNKLVESCEQGTEKMTAIKTLDFLMDYTEYPSEAFVTAVNKNITDWLVNHIQKWDKAVADYIKAQ